MYSDLYSTDIIVIGAGLSGLTAAYVLLEKVPTLSVMVLEANGNNYIIIWFPSNIYE